MSQMRHSTRTMRAPPDQAPLSILEITAASPSSSIITASKSLDNLAIQFPALESRILRAAKFLNAIAHEKHALERLGLCELIVSTAKHTCIKEEYRAKLPELRAETERRAIASDMARSRLDFLPSPT